MLSPYQGNFIKLQFFLGAVDPAGNKQKLKLNEEQKKLLLDFIVKSFPDGFALTSI